MLAHPGAQPLENIVHQRIAGAGQAVVHPFPIALDLDQAGMPELGEMAGNLWLVEPERAMQIADANLLLGQEV